jgi:hypothetical protein
VGNAVFLRDPVFLMDVDLPAGLVLRILSEPAVSVLLFLAMIKLLPEPLL